MEAREVYKDIYDTSIERLQNFNDIQREEFFKNNPEFVGLSNDEIAKKLQVILLEKHFLMIMLWY